MKVKRLVLLIAVFSMLGTVTVFADSLGQKIRVFVNGSELDSSGYLVDGKAMVPLRDLSDAIKGIVQWDDDSKKVTINKVNVHMFLFEDGIDTPFSNVKQGKYEFFVFAQIDNLLTDLSSVKLSIVDPYGKETDIKEQDVATQRESFWFRTQYVKYDFKYAGKYTVRFSVKQSKTSDYQVVSEKVIVSKQS